MTYTLFKKDNSLHVRTETGKEYELSNSIENIYQMQQAKVILAMFEKSGYNSGLTWIDGYEKNPNTLTSADAIAFAEWINIMGYVWTTINNGWYNDGLILHSTHYLWQIFYPILLPSKINECEVEIEIRERFGVTGFLKTEKYFEPKVVDNSVTITNIK